MTPFSNTNFKQRGPQYLKDNIDALHVCKNLLPTDSYAQMLTKSIATVAMTGADVNFAASGDDLLVTINGKSGLDPSATAAAGDDLAIANVNSAGSEIIVATDATDRIITNETGDTVDVPAQQITVKALSAVV